MKRGSFCWFSYEVEKNIKRYCPYWWDGRGRYAADFCRSGKHADAAINQQSKKKTKKNIIKKKQKKKEEKSPAYGRH